ncbi:ParB/RepB/Spo0J family partition protein [Streptomyces iranensis]|uniref:ParB/RepB/Spo0J family partition protein n=1 Tax=Streptomyces iranensis TaxID=576784 RepID=UPI0039B74CE4
MSSTFVTFGLEGAVAELGELKLTQEASNRAVGTEAFMSPSSHDATGKRPVQIVPIAKLKSADSPRLLGLDKQHINALATSDEPFPPIIVHRTSMRVVDGMHRLRAAELRGSEAMEVVFFDGDDESAFLRAVRENTAHGLRLSSADRTAAAARILCGSPHWSDRRIASVVGLSPTTVGAIRRRSTVQSEQSNARMGRDGRTRPLDNGPGRLIAGKLLSEKPDASVREVARTAGISLSTAYDVYKRVRTGSSPVAPKQRHEAAAGLGQNPPEPHTEQRTDPGSQIDYQRDLSALRKDPSLRLSERGRSLIRWLSSPAADEKLRCRLLESVPLHCVPLVVRLARENSRVWHRFADLLERREQASST